MSAQAEAVALEICLFLQVGISLGVPAGGTNTPPGRTCMERLLSAIELRRVVDVEQLLATRALPLQGRDGATALLKAVLSHDPRVVELVLKAGVDPNAEVQGGLTFWDAVRDEAVLDVLLEAGTDVNKELEFGRRPLHLAAQACPLLIVKRLLAAGARADVEDDFGETALSYAVTRGRDAVAKVLGGERQNEVLPREQERMNVYAAVLKTGLHGMSRKTAYYLSLDGKDPNDEMLKVLAQATGYELRRCSGLQGKITFSENGPAVLTVKADIAKVDARIATWRGSFDAEVGCEVHWGSSASAEPTTLARKGYRALACKRFDRWMILGAEWHRDDPM